MCPLLTIIIYIFFIEFTGLQMLHNLIKHYKKEFIKIPILRKLLKVNFKK